jgi:hypothetical protein
MRSCDTSKRFNGAPRDDRFVIEPTSYFDPSNASFVVNYIVDGLARGSTDRPSIVLTAGE